MPDHEPLREAAEAAECPVCSGDIDGNGDICTDCDYDDEVQYCFVHSDWYRGDCMHCARALTDKGAE